MIGWGVGIVATLLLALVGAVAWGRSQRKGRRVAEARESQAVTELEVEKATAATVEMAVTRSEETRAALAEVKENIDRADLNDLVTMVNDLDDP